MVLEQGESIDLGTRTGEGLTISRDESVEDAYQIDNHAGELSRGRNQAPRGIGRLRGIQGVIGGLKMAVAIDDCGRTHTDAQSLRERILSDYDEYQVPLAIDLFCGVGGVARTLHSYGPRGPGWETLGIDIDGSKADTYPGHFLEWNLEEGLPEIVDELVAAGIVDVIWASPPCQFATNVQFRRDGKNLIPVARDLLSSIDAPVKIIENVPGAEEHLENPVQFCGGAFGLGVQKHRLFETNFFAHGTDCEHPDGGFEYCIGDRETPVEGYRAAHGFRPDVDLTTKQVREAIPPAYVEELLHQYSKYGSTSPTPRHRPARCPA